MNLIEAFRLKPREVISLVGGGGKTTLMFSLAHELTAAGHKVITTTTTKIYRPSVEESPVTILLEDEATMADRLRFQLEKKRHITVARNNLPEDKLQGLSPQSILEIAGWYIAEYMIIEADGAKHRSLKAPNATEPVIPENTTLVIPVVGIDALNGRLNEEWVFRSEMAARLLDLPLNSTISTKLAANLFTHPRSILRDCPPQARIIPFVNKMDLEFDHIRGRELAKAILSCRHPLIELVLLGQANLPEARVREIINAY